MIQRLGSSEAIVRWFGTDVPDSNHVSLLPKTVSIPSKLQSLCDVGVEHRSSCACDSMAPESPVFYPGLVRQQRFHQIYFEFSVLFGSWMSFISTSGLQHLTLFQTEKGPASPLCDHDEAHHGTRQGEPILFFVDVQIPDPYTTTVVTRLEDPKLCEKEWHADDCAGMPEQELMHLVNQSCRKLMKWSASSLFF